MRITFILPPDSLAGGIRVLAVYARQLANAATLSRWFNHDIRDILSAR